MGSILLEIDDVSAYYNRKKSFLRFEKHFVFRELSFKIYAKETLGILGRNGAGKSTLLRMLAGITVPDAGKIVNHDVKVSLLALQAGFDPELNGIDNILLSGLFLGYSKKSIEKRIDDIIRFSELERSITFPIKTYSSGMKARLGFSIAMFLTPDIVLLDEVLGVGDIEFRKKSSNYMRNKINSDQTVVLVSHNAEMIKTLCDRAIWIEDGKIVEQGDPQVVYEKYESYMLEQR